MSNCKFVITEKNNPVPLTVRKALGLKDQMEAETHEQLIEMLASALSATVLESEIHFMVAEEAEAPNRTFETTTQKLRHREKTTRREQHNKLKKELEEFLKNTKGDIKVVITDFLNTTRNGKGDVVNRTDWALKRYDRGMKAIAENKSLQTEEQWKLGLEHLFIAVNRQYAIATDPKVREDLSKQLLKIRAKLGDEMIIAFPQYVQTLYDTVDAENNIYFLESPDIDGYNNVPNAIERELTDSIIAGLKVNGKEFGVARTRADGSYELYKVTGDTTVPVERKDKENIWTRDELFQPKTEDRMGKTRTHLQTINSLEVNRAITPRVNAKLGKQSLKTIKARLSKNISVISNLITVAGIEQKMNELNEGLSGVTYSQYPVFTQGREHLLKKAQIVWKDADNHTEEVLTSYVTKGLNLTIDIPIITEEEGKEQEFIAEFDTMNYYEVTKNEVFKIDFTNSESIIDWHQRKFKGDRVSEEIAIQSFFDYNFAAPDHTALDYEDENTVKEWTKKHGSEIPAIVLKTYFQNTYNALYQNYLNKIQILRAANELFNQSGEKVLNVSLKDLGIKDVKVRTRVKTTDIESPSTSYQNTIKIGDDEFKLFVLKSSKGSTYYLLDSEGKVTEASPTLTAQLAERDSQTNNSKVLAEKKGFFMVFYDENSYTESPLYSNKANTEFTEDFLEELKSNAAKIQYLKDNLVAEELIDTALEETDWNGITLPEPNFNKLLQSELQQKEAVSLVFHIDGQSLYVPLTWNVFEFEGAQQVNLQGYFSKTQNGKNLFSNGKYFVNNEVLNIFPSLVQFKITKNTLNQLLSLKPGKDHAEKEKIIKASIIKFSASEMLKRIKIENEKNRTGLQTKIESIQGNSTLKETLQKAAYTEKIEPLEEFFTKMFSSNPNIEVRAEESITKKVIKNGSFVDKTYSKLDVTNPVSKTLEYTMFEKQAVPEEQPAITSETITVVETKGPIDVDPDYRLEGESLEGDRPIENYDYVREILGGIEIRSVEDSLDLFKRVKDARILGAALGRTMFLSKDATQGVLYHEAFHIAFNGFFTQSEKTIALNEARSLFNPSQIDVLEYARKTGKTGTYDQLEAYYLEDQIADTFAEWKLKKGIEKSAFERLIGSVLSAIYQALEYLGLKRKDLESIFTLVDSGRLKSRDFNISSELHFSVKKEDGSIISSNNLNALIKQVYCFVLNHPNRKAGMENPDLKVQNDTLRGILKVICGIAYNERAKPAPYKTPAPEFLEIAKYFGVNLVDTEGNVIVETNPNANKNIEFLRDAIEKKLNAVKKSYSDSLDLELSEKDIVGENAESDDIKGKNYDQAGYELDPSNLDPHVSSLVEGAYHIYFKDGMKLFRPIVDPKKFISKMQKDFSVFPLEGNTPAESVNSFLNHLEDLAKVDRDYLTFFNHIVRVFDLSKEKDQWIAKSNKLLLNRLLNKTILTLTHYGMVVKKSDMELNYGGENEKFFSEYEVTDSFENREENQAMIESTLKNLRQSTRGPEYLDRFLTDKKQYIKVDKTWYSAPYNKEEEPISIASIGLPESKWTIEINMAQVINDYSLDKLYAQIQNNPAGLLTTEADKIKYTKALALQIESYFNMIGFNITPAFCLLLANDRRARTHIQSIHEWITSKGKPSPELRALLKSFIKYGSTSYITSIKNIEGKTVYALSKSNETSKFSPSATERKTKREYLPEVGSRVTDGIKVDKNSAFSEMSDFERTTYLISMLNAGYVNLSQLEGNKTNFSVYVKPSGQSVEDDIFEVVWDTVEEIKTNYKKAVAMETALNQLIDNSLSQVENQHKIDAYLKEHNRGWENIDKYKFELILEDNVQVVKLSDSNFTKTIKGNDGKAKNVPTNGFGLFFGLLTVTKNGVTYNNESNGREFVEAITSTPYTFTEFKEDLKLYNAQALEWAKEQAEVYANAAKNKSAKEYYKSAKAESEFRNVFFKYTAMQHKAYKQVLGHRYWMSFKDDGADFTKRLKALGAYGENCPEHTMIEMADVEHYIVKSLNEEEKFGHRDFKVLTLQEVKEQYPLYIEKGKFNKNAQDPNVYIYKKETTDGQAYSTLIHRLDTIEAKNRLSNESISYFSHLISGGNFLYQKIGEQWTLVEATPELVDKLHYIAKNEGFVNGGFKGVTGVQLDGLFSYYKDSEWSPQRDFFSRPILGKEAELKQLYKGLLESMFEEGTELSRKAKVPRAEQFKEIYKLLEPIEGQELLFNEIQLLETTDTDMLVYASGAKTLHKKSTFSDVNQITIPYGGKKHQTELSNNHTDLPASSQMMLYVMQDQDPKTKVIINGEEKTTAQLKDLYELAVKHLIDYRTKQLIPALLEGTGVDIDMLKNLLEDFVDRKRAKTYLKEYFSVQTGEVFNPSLPQSITLTLDFFNNLLKQAMTPKLPGDGFILMASSSYTVVEDEDGIIPLAERRERKGKSRPLQAYIEQYENGVWIRKVKYNPNLPVREVHEAVMPARDPWHKEYLKDRAEGMSQRELNYKYPQELFYAAGTRIPCENKRSMAVVKFVDFLDPLNGTIIITTTQMMDLSGHDHDADKFWGHLPVVIKEGNKGRWILDRRTNAKEEVMEEFETTGPYKRFLDSKLKDDETYVSLREKRSELKSKGALTEEQKVQNADIRKLLKELDKDSEKFQEFKGYIIKTNLSKDEQAELDRLEKQVKEKIKDIKSIWIKRYEQIAEGYTFGSAQNEFLEAQMALISNEGILKSGLGREQTEQDIYVEFTKDSLQFANFKPTYLLTIPHDVRKMKESASNKAGTGITASLTKSREMLDQMNVPAKHNLVEVDGKPLRFHATFKTPTGEVKDRMESLQDKVSDLYFEKFGERRKTEKGKTNSQTTSGLVGVTTDAVKNNFAFGISLNETTATFYSVAAMLGYPPEFFLTIGTHADIIAVTQGTIEDTKWTINSKLSEIAEAQGWNFNTSKFIEESPLKLEDIFNHPFNGKKQLVDIENTEQANSLVRLLGFYKSVLELNKSIRDFAPLASLNKGQFDIEGLLGLTDMLVDMGKDIVPTNSQILNLKKNDMYENAIKNAWNSFPLVNPHGNALIQMIEALNPMSMLSNQYTRKFYDSGLSKPKAETIAFSATLGWTYDFRLKLGAMSTAKSVGDSWYEVQQGIKQLKSLFPENIFLKKLDMETFEVRIQKGDEGFTDALNALDSLDSITEPISYYNEYLYTEENQGTIVTSPQRIIRNLLFFDINLRGLGSVKSLNQYMSAQLLESMLKESKAEQRTNPGFLLEDLIEQNKQAVKPVNVSKTVGKERFTTLTLNDFLNQKLKKLEDFPVYVSIKGELWKKSLDAFNDKGKQEGFVYVKLNTSRGEYRGDRTPLEARLLNVEHTKAKHPQKAIVIGNMMLVQSEEPLDGTVIINNHSIVIVNREKNNELLNGEEWQVYEIATEGKDLMNPFVYTNLLTNEKFKSGLDEREAMNKLLVFREHVSNIKSDEDKLILKAQYQFGENDFSRENNLRELGRIEESSVALEEKGNNIHIVNHAMSYQMPASENLTGKGTQEINEAGKQAITDVYEKTFGTEIQTFDSSISGDNKETC